MKLIQASRGLLEADNFFLTSEFSDFAGGSNVTRDTLVGTVSLKSNNKIERNFVYDEFVIELEKTNFSNIGTNDYAMIYVSSASNTTGIRENINSGEQCPYWKLLKYAGYVQAYVSPDGLTYTNIGGMAFTDTLIKQGFNKYSNEDFILKNYYVYSSPYLILQNMDENTICELYNSDNVLLSTRVFDSNKECKVFLENNNFQGYLVFKDPNNNVLYTSDPITFCYGDTWVMSPYNFEVLYLGNVVNDINPGVLQDLNELVSIKNIGTTDYTGIVIGTTTSSNDLVQLSLDGTTYTDTITTDIAQNVEVSFYVKITKNADNHNFKVRDFQLVINE